MIFTENKTHFGVFSMKGMNLNWILWIAMLSRSELIIDLFAAYAWRKLYSL